MFVRTDETGTNPLIDSETSKPLQIGEKQSEAGLIYKLYRGSNHLDHHDRRGGVRLLREMEA